MFYRTPTSTYTNSQRSKSSNFLWRFIANRTAVSQLSVSLILMFLSLNGAFASEFQLLRIANDLNLASDQFAKERGYSQGSISLSHRASSLAHESLQLIDAIERTRNPSNIRSQINDVGRRYTNLENAFWRAHGDSPDKSVFQKLEVISKIYSDLFAVYTSTWYYQSAPRIHIIVSSRLIENGVLIAPDFVNISEHP